MLIGALSHKTGCNVETIRYYERSGIIPAPERGRNNYRSYTADHLNRLQFVLRCRELGFHLDEIRKLLLMIDGENITCSDVADIGRSHLQDVRLKIRDLRRLEQTLDVLVSGCQGGDTPDCAMLETLFQR
jgi:MerR family transcriptional regulator, mercuric resistance operon regulatory protein